MFRRSRLDARRLDAKCLDVRHLNAGRLVTRRLDAGRLDARHLDAGRLDTRQLLPRILDAVVWTSVVWVFKEKGPNIMYRSLEAANSSMLHLDSAIPTGDVCTQAVWTSDVTTQPFRSETFGCCCLDTRHSDASRLDDMQKNKDFFKLIIRVSAYYIYTLSNKVEKCLCIWFVCLYVCPRSNSRKYSSNVLKLIYVIYI